MTNIEFPTHAYPDDVEVVQLEKKTILLVGTAHISRQSADLVEQVINQEQPDAICIELDKRRFAALSRRQHWKNLDLKEVIRKKQLATLLVNLILSSYQKKLGGKLGIMPGAELMAAAKIAAEKKIRIELCDRDVRVTLRRAWHSTSFFKKSYLLASLFSSLFDKTELDEEQLAALRKKDALSEIMKEIGNALPGTKKVLIDERDIYLAEKIKLSPGRRLVAVVGAGHVEGICRVIEEDNSATMAQIDTIPPVSPLWKIMGWSIPAAIVVAIIMIGIQKGAQAAGSNLVYWVLANGIPTAIGALLAYGHPTTILSAFIAAPLTSLTPVIGAGYVTAFVQVMNRPPLVKEFETVGEDIGRLTGWWQNKLLRIFLVFLLTGIGSVIGTWVGGYKIFSNLYS